MADLALNRAVWVKAVVPLGPSIRWRRRPCVMTGEAHVLDRPRGLTYDSKDRRRS